MELNHLKPHMGVTYHLYTPRILPNTVIVCDSCYFTPLSGVECWLLTTTTTMPSGKIAVLQVRICKDCFGNTPHLPL